MSGFIYLASPYSSPDAKVREDRCRRAQDVAAYCFRYGLAVYSPIAHWHPIAQFIEIPTDAAAHQKQNDIFMAASAGIAVLVMPGWEQSLGVQYEIQWAHENGIETRFVRNGRGILNHAKEVWGLDYNVHGLREEQRGTDQASLLDGSLDDSGSTSPAGVD